MSNKEHYIRCCWHQLLLAVLTKIVNIALYTKNSNEYYVKNCKKKQKTIIIK